MIDRLLMSVIIVNYNGAKYLPACLTALQEQTVPRHRFEVLLWDNFSKDDSVELVRRDYPWVYVFAAKKNTGFTGGNNQAATYARGGYLIFLNNDTIADPFFLEELGRVWQRQPAAWLVSKLMLAGQANVIQSTGIVALADGRGADRGYLEVDTGAFEQCDAVFAGCGAALGLPRPKHSTPIFDPDYFMYYEDFAAGWRHRLRGGVCLYVPRSLVLHVHGGSSGIQSELFHFHVERNRALTALRCGGWGVALYCVCVLFAKTLFCLPKTMMGLVPPRRMVTLSRACLSYLWLLPRSLHVRWSGR